MRTLGHREGNITHWGMLGSGGLGEGQCGAGRLGRDNIGKMSDVCDRRMETANHHGMCVPTQQFCKICTCTPEVQLKKKNKIKNNSRV